MCSGLCKISKVAMYSDFSMSAVDPITPVESHDKFSVEDLEETKTKKTRSKKQAIKELMNEFLQNTTLHGFSQIFSKTGYIRKLIWILAVLSCSIYAVVITYNTVSNYLQGYKSTSISMQYDDEIAFPSVTICNINPVKKSKLEGIFREQNISEEAINSIIFISKIISNRNVKHLQNFVKKENDQSGINLKNFMLSFIHSMKEMLISTIEGTECLFGDEMACDYRNFSEVQTRFGVCYTFNSESSSRIYTENSGRDGGLKVTLNIEAEEYTSSAYPGTGIKVLVHEPDEYPLVDELGFSVQPGAHTFVAMTKKKFSRRGETGKIPSEPDTMKYMKYLDGYRYTRPACMFNCQLNEMVEKCGCLPYYINADKFGIQLCSLIEFVECRNRILKGKSLKSIRQCRRECPRESQSVKYDVEMSYSKLPSKPVVDLLMMNGSGWSGINSTELLKKYFSDNLLQLDIYYKEMSYMDIIEYPAMTYSDLLGNIGGNSGLWLGMSILTFLEILDLLLHVIKILCFKNDY